MLKKMLFMTPVKIIRQTLFRTIAIAIGITAMGFCSGGGGERERERGSEQA